jgi:hypothetical protein
VWRAQAFPKLGTRLSVEAQPQDLYSEAELEAWCSVDLLFRESGSTDCRLEE